MRVDAARTCEGACTPLEGCPLRKEMRAIARGTAIVTRRAETPEAARGAKRLESVSGEAGCPLTIGDRIDQFAGVTLFQSPRKDARLPRFNLSY